MTGLSQAQLSYPLLLVIWFRDGHVAQFWPVSGEGKPDFSRRGAFWEGQCTSNFVNTAI